MEYEQTVIVMRAIMEPMRHERPEKTHYHFCADMIIVSDYN